MKQTFNLLAEVLALPYSPTFLRDDFLADSIRAARKEAERKRQPEIFLPELAKQIGRKGIRAAEAVDVHTSFSNTGDLQSMVRYVYDARALAKAAAAAFCPGRPEALAERSPTDLANLYEISLCKRIAASFLTLRDEKAVFKTWSEPSEIYPHTEQLSSGERVRDWERDLLDANFETHRIEAWHSLLQCIPESLLLSAFAACLSEDAPDPQAACIRSLRSFGDTVHIADAMLERILAYGLAETHLHAGASRTFDWSWETILSNAVTERPALKTDYFRTFQEPLTREAAKRNAGEAVLTRALLAAYLRSAGGASPAERTFSGFLLAGIDAERDIRAALARTAEQLARDGKLPADAGREISFLYIIENRGLQKQPGELRRFLQGLLGRCGAAASGLPEFAGGPFSTDVGFQERCFMALSMLHIGKKPEDTGFTAAFLYYLRHKSFFYRDMVQDSKSRGLAYFQRVYDFSTNTGWLSASEEKLHILYTALKDPRMRKTELRFSPPVSKRKSIRAASREIEARILDQTADLIRRHLQVMAILYGVRQETPHNAPSPPRWDDRWDSVRHMTGWEPGSLRELLREYGTEAERVPPHRVGVIIHLIKQGEYPEEPACFVKYSGEREKVRPERQEYMCFSFGNARFQYEATVRAIVRVRRLSPELSRLLVGLDAASVELSTNPWVFVPSFRLARNLEFCPASGAESEKTARQSLGLTYHVGEEFRHPLSGLRHIGETIDGFQLRAGDRLGHALALGADLDRWFSSHDLITIPLAEWMEDCLWAWEIAAQNGEVDGLHEFTQFLEDEVMSCADEIYGSLNGISIRKLCIAYRGKTLNVPDLEEISIRWSKKNGKPSRFNCSAAPECGYFPCALNASHEQARPEDWWSEDALILSYHCDYYKNRMNREKLRQATPREIVLTKALQRYLRGEIAKRGIVVEENPSSNAVIGEIDGVLAHPICELRSKNAPAVISSVNTDDPSVFNSNVANEHALIYFSLIHRGYSVEDALRMTDGFRKAGIESSFLEDAPPFEQLLREYEEILRAIHGAGRG